MHKLWLILFCFTLPMHAMHKNFMPDHLAPHEPEEITSTSWHHTSKNALTVGTATSTSTSSSSSEPTLKNNELPFSARTFKWDIESWRDVVPAQNNDGHLHELAILIALKSHFPAYSLETIMSLLPPNALKGVRTYIGQEAREKIKIPFLIGKSKNFPEARLAPFEYNNFIFNKVLTKHREKLSNLIDLYKELEEVAPVIEKMKTLMKHVGKTNSVPSSSDSKPFANWLATYLEPQPPKPAQPDEAKQATCTQSNTPRSATPEVPDFDFSAVKQGVNENIVKPITNPSEESEEEEDFYSEPKKPASKKIMPRDPVQKALNPKDPARDQAAAWKKYLETEENNFQPKQVQPTKLQRQQEKHIPRSILEEQEQLMREQAYLENRVILDERGEELVLLEPPLPSYEHLLKPSKNGYKERTLLAQAIGNIKPALLKARLDCIQEQIKHLKLTGEQAKKVWPTELLAQNSSGENPLEIAKDLLKQVLENMDDHSKYKQPLEEIIGMLQPLYQKYCPEKLKTMAQKQKEAELRLQQQKLFSAIENDSTEQLETLELSETQLLNPVKVSCARRTLLAQAVSKMKPAWLEAWLDCIRKQIQRLKLSDEQPAKVWRAQLLAQDWDNRNPLEIAHNLLNDRYSEHKQPLEKIIALLQPLYEKYCPKKLKEIEQKHLEALKEMEQRKLREKLFSAIENNSIEPLKSLELSEKQLLNPVKFSYAERTLLAQAVGKIKPVWLKAWLVCIQNQIQQLKLSDEQAAKVWRGQLLAQDWDNRNSLEIAKDSLRLVLKNIEPDSKHKKPLEQIIAQLQPLYEKHCPEALKVMEKKQLEENLLSALQEKNSKTVGTLIAQNPNLVNCNSGHSPLDYACAYEDLASARILLEAGADPQTEFDSEPEIKALLLEYANKKAAPAETTQGADPIKITPLFPEEDSEEDNE